MITRYAALLRGVNVGRANRISMADLRASVEALGYTEVRTLLNSGNVMFSTSATAPEAEAAIVGVLTRHGITTPVIVVPREAIGALRAANPFATIATDPSRFLVALFAGGRMPARVMMLADQDWGEERFAMAHNAAFLWCPSGILQSPLLKAFNRGRRRCHDDTELGYYGEVTPVEGAVLF